MAVGALNKKDTPDWNCSTTRGGLNEVLHMGSAVVMKCGVRSAVCVYTHADTSCKLTNMNVYRKE